MLSTDTPGSFKSLSLDLSVPRMNLISLLFFKLFYGVTMGLTLFELTLLPDCLLPDLLLPDLLDFLALVCFDLNLASGVHTSSSFMRFSCMLSATSWDLSSHQSVCLMSLV